MYVEEKQTLKELRNKVHKAIGELIEKINNLDLGIANDLRLAKTIGKLAETLPLLRRVD